MRQLLTLALLCCVAKAQDAAVPFSPFARLGRAYGLVNSISFSPDGRTMYVALLHRQVLAARNLPVSSDAPEVAIYQASREGDEWGEPLLAPFSGRWHDYEPVMAPDGSFIIFQSRRPIQPGRPVSEKNNLWRVRRTPAGWSDPEELTALNLGVGASYSTIADDGRVFFLRDDAGPNGTVDYNIYVARPTAAGFSEPERVPPASSESGESDPWISRDGSFLIFTRFSPESWDKTCDLYISFFSGDKWSAAMPLDSLNTAGPDYGVAISPDQEWIYYRSNNRFIRRPLAPLIETAREAVRKRG